MSDNSVVSSSNMPFFKDIIRYIKQEMTKEEAAVLDQHLLCNERAWELFQHLYELKQKGELDAFLTRQQELLPFYRNRKG